MVAVPGSVEAATEIAKRQKEIDAILKPEPEPVDPNADPILDEDAEDLGEIAGRFLAEVKKALRLNGHSNGNGNGHIPPRQLSGKKKIEYDGMTLWREPSDLEKQINLKAIRDAFEDGEKTLAASLLDIRNKLIDDAAAGLVQLAPADFHTLILSAPETATAEILEKLTEIYNRGRELVLEELVAQGAGELGGIGVASDADTRYLDNLAGTTVSRVTNDVQSRASGRAVSLYTLGVEDMVELSERVQAELAEGSAAYVDAAAAEADHGGLGAGRAAEGADRSDIVANVYYSAVLDESTCQPCEDADGETGETEDDITPAPNPSCEGWARCRCILIYVFDSESAN
jgi:hypothetical protein